MAFKLEGPLSYRPHTFGESSSHWGSEESLDSQDSETLSSLSDQKSACLEFQDYHFTPIAEAAQDLREQLAQSILPLKEDFKKIKDVQQGLLTTADCIQQQSYQTKRQIQDQFIKLHQFLYDEEEARLRVLTEEEEQKIQSMKEKMVVVSREIELLSETIRTTEQQIATSDVSFLLKYKTTVERVQRCQLLDEPELGPDALIDQAKHLGNLVYNIWSSMKTLARYSPVILDPNKSTTEIILSEDLTSFTSGNQRNPGEKDVNWALVMGSEGFDRGCRSWGVEVGNSAEWALGVLTDSLEKDGAEGWSVAFSDDEYAAVLSEKNLKSLQLDSNPVRIRVCLDCDRRELSFYDADSGACIHSFAQISDKKVFPYFATANKYEIKIQPEDVPLV
ncbi:unnamed protein product [Knipowitschia caucasica]